MAISVGSVSVDVVPDLGRFVPELRGKLRDLPTVSVGVDADTRAAEAAISRLGRDQTATVSVDADTRAAQAAIGRISRNQTVKVGVDADTRVAQTAISRLGRNQTAKVDVDADTGKATAEIERATRDRTANVDVRVDDQGSILSTTNRLGALLTAGVALGPAIVPAAAAAAAAIGAIGIGAAAAGAGIGTLVLGFSGIGDAVKAMSAAQQSAGADAAKSATAQVAAAEQVRSAEAALVNTRANAGDAAVRSARAVAEAQVGVRDATREAAQSMRDALAAQATAQRGVQDAARSAAKGVRDALRQQVDAQRAVEDATRSAARSVADALFAQENAEQSLASAQLAARQAQLSLTQAREDARRSLEDLTLQVEGGALAQRRAVIGVQEAQDALNVAMTDPKATQRQRDLAQLAFDEATQNLEEIGVRNRRLAEEKAAADKAGIEGSRQVQAATAGIADAEDRVSDARVQAARAADAVTEARRAGAERVTQANERAAQAEAAVEEARRAGAERMLAAREALARADSRVADARVEGERRVADAQARVGEAVAASAAQQRSSAFAISQAQAAVATAHRQAADAASASSAAQTKVATAMAALSPAGQRFAKFLFSLRNQFNGLKAAAQGGMLPGVESGIRSVLPLMPILEKTVSNAAKAMGDLFARAGEALNSPFWREFFTMIQNTVGPNLTTFGEIIGNLATGFAGLLMAFQPLNEQLGGGLLDLSKRFAEFGAGASKNAGFQSFLKYVQENGPLVVSTIWSVAKAIGRIILALAPIGPMVLQSIGFLADVINRIPVDVLTVLAVSIGGLVVGFRIFAAAIWLVNIAMNANPISLIIIGLVALGAGLVIAYRHSETFRKVVDATWSAIKTGADAAWKILKPILSAIADWVGHQLVTGFNDFKTVFGTVWKLFRDGVKDAWDNIFRPVFSAIGTAIGTTLPNAFRTGRDWIVARFNTVRDAVKNAWDKHIKPVFTAIGDAITKTVPEAFRSGVDAIKSAWDRIKGYAKAPVRFVIETVLNHGILAAFNSISEHLGNPVKHINSIPLPKGFARGTEDHRAQIAHPNQPRLWAEPETGGEAYIPLAPSKRHRSSRILDDVARRFGYGLIKMANGGTLITAGRHLRDLGYSVGEGPDGFGPVHRVHAPHSRHYDGMALDINHGAGTSKAEQAALSRIVPYLKGMGLRIIFMAPGHYNHLHAEVPRGKGLASQIGGLVGGAAGAVADFLDPAKLITGPLEGLLARIPGRDSTLGKLVAGVPKVLAKALVERASAFVGAIAGTGGDLKDTPGTGGYGGAARWAQTVMVVLRQLGQPTSAVGAVLRRIQFESGGNPHAINKWDINARRGHPSMGLMQTIPGTFNAYAGPYMARGIYDPLANIYAGVNYALHTYGSLAAIDPKNRPRGYDAGGYLQPGLTTVYNGTGKPEPVFTPEQFAAMRANGGSRGGLVINGDVHTASVEEFMREAAARQRLDAALHPIFA